jgi:hypothetical protein
MSIYKKLHEAKKEIGAITKDSTNPFFKNSYFDINKILSEVEPILEKNGLLVLQPIKEGKVITQIIDAESGEKVESEMTLPIINDPQKLGSAITYFRRYTIQSLLSLQAEDDDGNKAAKQVKKQSQPQKKKLDDNQFHQSIVALKKGTVKQEQFKNYELTAPQNKIFTETLILIGK